MFRKSVAIIMLCVMLSFDILHAAPVSCAVSNLGAYQKSNARTQDIQEVVYDEKALFAIYEGAVDAFAFDVLSEDEESDAGEIIGVASEGTLNGGFSTMRRKQKTHKRYLYKPSLFNLWTYNLLHPMDKVIVAIAASIRGEKARDGVLLHHSLPQVKNVFAIGFQIVFGVVFHIVANWGASEIVGSLQIESAWKARALTFGIVVYWSLIHVGLLTAREGYSLAKTKKPILLTRRQHILRRIVERVGLLAFITTIAGYVFSFWADLTVIDVFGQDVLSTVIGWLQAVGVNISSGAVSASRPFVFISDLIAGNELASAVKGFLGFSEVGFKVFLISITGVGLLLWEMVGVVSRIDENSSRVYDFSALKTPSNMFKVVFWLAITLLAPFVYFGHLEYYSYFVSCFIAVAFMSYFVDDVIRAGRKASIFYYLAVFSRRVFDASSVEKMKEIILNPKRYRNVEVKKWLPRRLFNLFIKVKKVARSKARAPHLAALTLVTDLVDQEKKRSVSLDVYLRQNASRVLVENVNEFFVKFSTGRASREKEMLKQYRRLILFLGNELLTKGWSEKKHNQRLFAISQLCDLVENLVRMQKNKQLESVAHVMLFDVFEEAIMQPFEAGRGFETLPVREKLLESLNRLYTEVPGAFLILEKKNGPLYRELGRVLNVDFQGEKVPSFMESTMHFFNKLHNVFSRNARVPTVIGLGGGVAVGREEYAQNELVPLLESQGRRVLIVRQADFLKSKQILAENDDVAQLEDMYRLKYIRDFARDLMTNNFADVLLPPQGKEGEFFRRRRVDLYEYDVVLFVGTYALSDNPKFGDLESVMDVRIFMEEEYLFDRERWLKEETGLTGESFVNYQRKVLDDTVRNVLPTRQYADYIIRVDDYKRYTIHAVQPSIPVASRNGADGDEFFRAA